MAGGGPGPHLRFSLNKKKVWDFLKFILDFDDIYSILLV